MNALKTIAIHPTFSICVLEEITGNKKSAYSMLERYIKKGYVKKVRNNLYSPVNLTTGEIVATRFQIACAIAKDAYISHHSALEFYGLSNQVFYDVNVTSSIRFNHFEYEGITYKYITPRIKQGIIDAKNMIGVRLTDLERTILDSINDVNKIGGLEELGNALDNIRYLNEDKLKEYLKIYQTHALYQKAGYLLSKYQENMQLTDFFFDFCKKNIKKTICYLVSDASRDYKFVKEWNLMVPIEHYKGDDVLV